MVKATSGGTDASPELPRIRSKRAGDRRELQIPAVSGVGTWDTEAQSSPSSPSEGPHGRSKPRFAVVAKQRSWSASSREMDLRRRTRKRAPRRMSDWRGKEAISDWRDKEAINEAVFREMNEWTAEGNDAVLGSGDRSDAYCVSVPTVVAPSPSGSRAWNTSRSGPTPSGS
jgi:hypothetical protein